VASQDPTPADAEPQDSPAPLIDEKALAVKPVEEPEWPLPGDEAGVRKLGYVPLPGGGYQYEKRVKEVIESGVVVPGRILMNRGVIELLACAEGGKEHESVLRIDCDIQALDLALRLSGYKNGPVPEALGEEGNQGQRLVALVQWKSGEKTVTYRAEDLVISVKRRGPMPRVGWTYVASFVEVDNPGAPKKKTPVLAATGTRSLITTWRDPSSILDNPLPDAVDDTAFAANHVVLPDAGTRVAVILRAPTKGEQEGILKVEKELK
jgi:hypothetical protein